MSYKYASIIPLVGGMVIGNKQATGLDPEFMLSYSAFESNDSHIVEYLNEVPYYALDDEENKVPNLKSKYYKNIDFMTSVCPCAGLSMLNCAQGTKMSRGSDAPQNNWMYQSAEWVFENVRPKVYWGENAPSLYTSMGKGVRDKLKSLAKEYGYSLSIVKTDTFLHGIPQHRPRTFYFFWDSKTAPILSWIKKDTKTLSEYLNEIPEEASYKDVNFAKAKDIEQYHVIDFILEKEGLELSEFRKVYRGGIFSYIYHNDLFDEAIEWLEKNSFDDTKEYKKINYIKGKKEDGLGFWDSSPFLVKEATNSIISKTMACLVHPDEFRYLNIREYMWLMGLPHDFKLTNKKFNHIAQNVPVTTAKTYTEEVMKYLDGNLMDSGYSFVMQNNISQKIDESSNFRTIRKNSLL